MLHNCLDFPITRTNMIRTKLNICTYSTYLFIMVARPRIGFYDVMEMNMITCTCEKEIIDAQIRSWSRHIFDRFSEDLIDCVHTQKIPPAAVSSSRCH